MHLKLFFILLAAFTLSASTCNPEKGRVDLALIWDKGWYHSYEEDSAEFKAYRPETFNFPPARGRVGFKIQKDSTFIYYAIAAADGTEKQYGKWKQTGPRSIEVNFDKKSRDLLKWELVRANKDFLLIKE